jgi:arsenate reductase
MKIIVFACVHNAGRSQMAEAFFNALANPAQARATSAGTRPGPWVHPEVVRTMAEIGIDLADAIPRRLTPELAAGASFLITMGCGDECPFIPGAIRQDWPLADPKGRSHEEVRSIRDEIHQRVIALVTRSGWSR